MKIEVKDNIVTNDGDEIGAIHGSTCRLVKTVGPTVKSAIKKAAGVDGLAFVVGAPDEPEKKDEEEVSEDDLPPSLADMSDDDLAAEMKRRGLIQDAPPVLEAPAVVQPPVKERDLSAVERLHDLAIRGEIPPPPAKHPAMGDKDPAYVAWFKTYATPAEIATRYPENRRVPASEAEFLRAQAKLQDKLPGEKKDTDKSNDFTDPA